MKVFSIILFFAAVCVFSTSVFSQDRTLNDGQVQKNALAAIVAKKTGVEPFVLLKPSDLAGLSSAEVYSLINGGDPCSLALGINFGDTVNGSLTSTDCRLEDNSYADFYFFTGNANQQISITLNSTAFDTYLGLANETGSYVVEDDNGGGGTNSRIAVALPESGTYIILANSALPNRFGAYSLNLSGCTYSLNPTSAELPGIGGTFSFGVNTQPGCQWGAIASDSFIEVINNNGNGSGTVTYSVGINTSGATRNGTINVRGQIFSISQPSINCTYSITPTSVNHAPDAVTAVFTMNTAEGCPWIADDIDWWLWTSNELRRGPGMATYTVAANNGGPRTGTITVAGNTFTVNQAGRNCTYSVSPTTLTVSPAGQYGQFNIDTQPGCTWSFSGALNYVYFEDGGGGIGSGVKIFRAWANNTFAVRTWILQFNGNTTVNIHFTQNGIPYRTGFDFFGDSKTDISIFRPSTNEWIVRDSQYNGVYTYQFGSSGDIIVPADYNGDRRAEVAVFRPSNGTWYFLDGVNTYSAFPFGIAGDVPAPGDFDGDGKADVAVFRPSTGIWYIRRSMDNSVSISRFGAEGDAPVASDYDGDGKTDIAIWRPSVGEWWIARSSDNQVVAAQFGNSSDKTVQGDYTGDGKADIAVWRPSDGFWYILRSENGSYFAFPWGMEGDIPAPGDYDADGKFDATVFRPSIATWYSSRTSAGIIITNFGSPGDVPVPSAFVR